MAERAEVVVVGGGVIGTSIAFHLTRLGMRDIILLERSHLAAGSTGRSVGIVETTYSTDVNVGLAKIGWEELRRFPEVTGHTADFVDRPYLETVTSPRHRTHIDAAAEIGRRHGLHHELVEPNQVQDLFPEMRTDDIAAGLLCREAGFCDPHSVAKGYAEAAARDGARIRVRTTVDRILLDRGDVVGVRTPQGDVRASVVVNAAGPWCNDLLRPLGFDLPVRVWQRQIFVTTPHPEIPPDRPMYVDVTGRFYFRQERDGGFVLGLVEDTAAQDPVNPETDWALKVRAVGAAVHRVPKLADTQIANAWSGIVTFTPDQLPVLGPVREAKGLFLANGMSGYGVMISPAVGLLLAEMIVKGEARSLDVRALGYERFQQKGPVRPAGLWLADG